MDGITQISEKREVVDARERESFHIIFWIHVKNENEGRFIIAQFNYSRRLTLQWKIFWSTWKFCWQFCLVIVRGAQYCHPVSEPAHILVGDSVISHTVFGKVGKKRLKCWTFISFQPICWLDWNMLMKTCKTMMFLLIISTELRTYNENSYILASTCNWDDIQIVTW